MEVIDNSVASINLKLQQIRTIFMLYYTPSESLNEPAFKGLLKHIVLSVKYMLQISVIC